MLTLGYAPFSIWPLAFLGTTIFLFNLSRCEKEQAKWHGFGFGLGWFGTGLSWVHVSIADFGGLPLIGSIGLMILLCAYLAIFPALVAHYLKRVFKVHIWPLALPLLWLFAEWIRSWLFTGFPWLSIGYSQINSPLSGWLPVVGEFGLSALMISFCSLVAVSIATKQWRSASLMGAVFFLTGSVLNQYQWVKETGETVDIAMVQGNIKQELRWLPEQDQPTMQKYLRMTENHWHNEIIIWPEAAIPKLEPLSSEFLATLDKVATDSDTGVITGIVNYNFETRQAFNSLIGLGIADSDDQEGHYRYQHSNRFYKHHLLPIGEVIPFEDWLRGLAPIFDLPMSSFTRGDFQQNNMVLNGHHLAPAICFEIAFPRQIAANLYAQTDFIITVSNDAWFGQSHGPAQHLEIAQVRAKEFGLPVLRATNTGITAFIDHNGHIQSRLPQFKAAVLSDQIAKVSGQTPYRTFGDSLAWTLAILSMLLAWKLRKHHTD